MFSFRLILIAIFAAHGNAILSSNIEPASIIRQCPHRNCKCDGVNIICDCYGNFQEVIVEKLEQTSASDLRINNCQKVMFKSESIKYLTNLRYVTLQNIKNLHLESRSLNWCGFVTDCKPEHYYAQAEHPSLDVTIKNTTITEIEGHAFSERIRNILLEEVNFENIRAYAFNNLKSTKKLEIKGSRFKNVESQAFKKFYVDYLSIESSFFEVVPSRTFADINVLEDFNIRKSNFSVIKPQGFLIKNAKTVEIFQSYFGELEGESFKLTVKGRVQIKNNIFEKVQPNAFVGISTTNKARLMRPELLFINNTVANFQKDSLAINRTSFTPKFETIILKSTCACSEIHTWQKNTDYLEEIFCLVQSGRVTSPLNIRTFNQKNCLSNSSNWIILTSAIVGSLLFIIIIICLAIFLYRRHRIQKKNEQQNGARNKNGAVGLIVPDGRTYRETELHVIVEKAELLTTEL